ncbi:MAG: hypothetical protein ACYTGZ_22530 [Planctomycetota bacterium]|jgi:hypothetical protein
MLTSLPELVQRCVEGDEELQRALLDEVEPLLFGYMRSLVPAGDDAFDSAVAHTHAATLGFLLDLRGGRIRMADAAALRGYCHRTAVERLRDPEPVFLAAAGDQETGGLTPMALEWAERFETALSVDQVPVASQRLLGSSPNGWTDVAQTLNSRGLLRHSVSD